MYTCVEKNYRTMCKDWAEAVRLHSMLVMQIKEDGIPEAI